MTFLHERENQLIKPSSYYFLTHSFVNVFKEEMIDGKLLMDLDRRMLINDLGMNEFQATKLLRFQRGWRPK